MSDSSDKTEHIGPTNYYNQQRNGAQSRLESIGHLDTPAESQTRQSMIDSEGYARYNAGPSAQYWSRVEPDQNVPNVGYWIANPTVVRNHRRILLDDLGIHVSNYLANY